jgi:hypothetical protein
LPAQRGLRDVQPLRCLCEVQFFCNGDEIAQVPQVHVSTQKVSEAKQSYILRMTIRIL